MPFWVYLTLAFMGMIYFSFFIEAIFLFFLSDLLYGTKEARFFDMFFVSFIISILLLIFVEFLKRKLKFYP